VGVKLGLTLEWKLDVYYHRKREKGPSQLAPRL
jgi:hypothetical protein